MASSVDICNLALSNLGDTAEVTSIEPPDGSAQAQHCSRFYPIARNSLLEMACWNFATKRITLAQVTNPSTEWQFAYSWPNLALTIIAIHYPDSSDDYSQSVSGGVFQNDTTLNNAAIYTPQPYSIETDSNGNNIILTNVGDAIARYTLIVTDPNKFSPLFVDALSWLLSAKLAGPLLKGDTGAAEAKRCLAMFEVFKNEAISSDANQRNIQPQQSVPWIAGR